MKKTPYTDNVKSPHKPYGHSKNVVFRLREMFTEVTREQIPFQFSFHFIASITHKYIVTKLAVNLMSRLRWKLTIGT